MVAVSKNEKNGCECYLVSCRLLTTNLNKNDTPPWVFLIHFATENRCPCFQNTLIRYSVLVLELTLLKFTQYCNNICLAMYIFLTNPFMVHSGRYLLLLVATRQRHDWFETLYYCSSSATINQIVWLRKQRYFKSKFKLIIPAVKLQTSATNRTIYYLLSIRDNAWMHENDHIFTFSPSCYASVNKTM